MDIPLILRDATLYLESGAQRGDMLVVGERIAAVGDVRAPSGSRERNLQGREVLPGLVDLQVNGCAGSEVYEASMEALRSILRALPRFGCTSVLPTMVSASEERYQHLGEALAGLRESRDGARVLGVHLEGPYLSPSYPGAHRPDVLRQPDVRHAEALLDALGALVRVWTIAPELRGGAELIDLLISRSVVVAAGHSALSFEESPECFKRGVTLVTHLFNAMAPLHHRAPGLAAAALLDPSVRCSLIADGYHVHPAVVRLASQLASDRMILVTDAVSAAGCPDGMYELAGQLVKREGGTVRTRDGVLAGSTLTALQALKNFSNWLGVALVDALPVMTTRPADLIGRTDVGRLAEGAYADFLVLDTNGDLLETHVGGECVWEKQAA